MHKDLEIRHCRVLVALSEHGGIAAAARSLGLAQSTVSESLLSLERVLGTPVILRRPGREAALTPAANALMPHARALVSASETALQVFFSHSQGVLRLGTVESISSFLLPRPLSAFKVKWPGVDVQITVGLCEDLRKRVRRLELDAALSIEGEGADHQGDAGWQRLLSPSQLRLVVSPTSPLSSKVVGRDSLALNTFLLADPDGAFNRLIQAWFAKSSNPPKLESAGSIDGVKRGVLNGQVIGVLPSYAVVRELASGSLTEVRVREPLPSIALRMTTLEAPLPSSPLYGLVEEIDNAFNAA